jgi:hypothetical protein
MLVEFQPLAQPDSTEFQSDVHNVTAADVIDV